ncbi:MAG: MG2 domain-containing protein [Candidatus Electryonea clarkiae]|nr:MG2 domain-containing protein [Candidatus Electryonea clarkiae]MDP8288755.1 MG2 domain-containing protein [Candidatus Electryonea clarkiae]
MNRTYGSVRGMRRSRSLRLTLLDSDRGVYRPGETAYITTIVRGKKLSTPNDYPVRVEVKNPGERLFAEKRGRLNDQGMCEFEIDIPSYSRTGRYNVKLYAEGKNPINTYTFSVEEFMPDRIKATVTTDKQSYQSGETITINVQGNMLFGPPAKNRKYQVKSWFESYPFKPAKYPGYTFANPYGKISDIEKELGGGNLDENGQAELKYYLPEGMRPPSTTRAVIEATVYENGGRAVNNRTWAIVHPYPFYIGVKRVNETYATTNQDELFKWVVLTADGQPLKTKGLIVRLNQIRYQSIVEIDERGRYRYVSEKYPTVIQTIHLDDAKKGEFSLKIPEYGEYEIQIEHEASGTQTGLNFHASGWGYAPWSMEHPDRIELELDQNNYTPGENARVLVKAPISGQLLLTVERDKVLYSKLQRMNNNTAEISLPVIESFGPNAYITATLVRTPHDGDKHSPMRAFGIAPIKLDMSMKRINIAIDAPAKTLPGKPLQITLTLPGEARNAKVTIAAIDEGILQLTDFSTPEPYGFFYGKRRLEVDTYDIFNLLMPEIEPAEIHSSPSGDRSMRRRSHLNTMSMARVKPVALWSGILPVHNGRVIHQFDIPEFNGQLRIMAVAVSGDKFGATDKDVIVKAPIVLTPYFPRFISGNDKLTVPVSIFNSTGKDGDFTVKLDIDGPVKINGDNRYTLHLKNDEEKEISFELSAEVANKLATFTLSASGGGKEVTNVTHIPVRPPTPPLSETGHGSIKAGSQKTIKFEGDWIPNTAYYSLHCMSLPQIEFARSLQYLLRYPYGCLEQTTSKAFPLLYFKDLARIAEPDRFEENAPEYYIEGAITRIASMQSNNGYFRFWPNGGRVNPWATVYALHFLVEASQLDYSVPKSVIAKGEKYLKYVVKAEKRSGNKYKPGDVYSEYYWLKWDDKKKLRIKAYALFLLAKMGSPDLGAMHRLLETNKNTLDFDTKILLAGAFGHAGDMKTALSLVPNSPPPDKEIARSTGRTFNSSMRSDAMCLYMLQDVAPDHFLIPLLTKSLNKRYNDHYRMNTQEAAWFFLAFGKLVNNDGDPNYEGNLLIDGKPAGKITTEPFTFIDSTMGNKSVEIQLTGEGRCYYFWEARGLPRKFQFHEVKDGIEISRRYLTSEGAVISLEDAPQGELVFAQIKVKAEKYVQNVIINDLLPSGFEIENPRLESREHAENLPKSDLNISSMDIRDDRLLVYTYLVQNKEFTYHYVLRAVTAGTFVLPPVTAESMYDPAIRGSGSSGYITVKR